MNNILFDNKDVNYCFPKPNNYSKFKLYSSNFLSWILLYYITIIVSILVASNEYINKLKYNCIIKKNYFTTNN